MTKAPGALAAAIADPAGRAARDAAARRFAGWWRARPALIALETQLAAIDPLAEDAGDAAIKAARPLIERIEWVEDALAFLVREARADPLFEPPLRTVQHEFQAGFALVDHPRLRIAVMVLPAQAIAARKTAALGPRAVAFSGAQSLTRFIRAAGAMLDLWDAPPVDAAFSAARAGHCRSAGRLELHDGMIVRIDGARRSWTFAAAPDDIVVLQASARIGMAPLMAEYDARDGHYLAASATDGAASRLRLLANMLGRMECTGAAPLLAELVREAPFDLRWALARETLALDRGQGLALVRSLAADDPHPEVRAAAAQTLELLAA